MRLMSAIEAMAIAPRQDGTPGGLTLGDQVYGHIRRLLIAGRLTPGDKLALRPVADALGVSMMPVREAVSRLVADRALEVTPNRAVRVPIMRRRQFAEMARIRCEIEGFAAGEAARLRGGAGLDAIRTAEARFSSLATSATPDLAAAVEANQAFHFVLYDAAGLPDLVEIIGSLWLKVGPVINFDLRDNPERLKTGSAARLHAEALDAVLAGDAARARAAIAADIQGAAEFILSRDRLPD
jgi:DNA-binding GntR family transcriptional regulator